MKGLVHVYTGCGKGKTTCSLGLALRALGWGKRVCMVQFIKGWQKTGEMQFARGCEGFDLIQTNLCDTLNITKSFAEAAGPACREALERAGEIIRSGKYDLVILDEVNGAADMGFVSPEEIVALIKGKPDALELVLTGRNAKAEVMEAADYVTEMTPIKHPYDRGIKARKGVDF